MRQLPAEGSRKASLSPPRREGIVTVAVTLTDQIVPAMDEDFAALVASYLSRTRDRFALRAEMRRITAVSRPQDWPSRYRDGPHAGFCLPF